MMKNTMTSFRTENNSPAEFLVNRPHKINIQKLYDTADEPANHSNDFRR